MTAGDTSNEAARIQALVYRRMGPERRVRAAAEMSEDARRISAGGIRSRHPQYTDAQVRHALNRLVLGDALFAAAWPKAPLLAP